VELDEEEREREREREAVRARVEGVRERRSW
jgi:hypothetical protein